MGNRAAIVFFDRSSVSPTVYLHWHGNAFPGWLDQLSMVMKGRYADATYAAARFVGICHGNIDGNMSLGISSNRFDLSLIRSEPCMHQASPGDAGIVVVDTSDFSWRAYGGYLATVHLSTTSIQESPHGK